MYKLYVHTWVISVLEKAWQLVRFPWKTHLGLSCKSGARRRRAPSRVLETR